MDFQRVDGCWSLEVLEKLKRVGGRLANAKPTSVAVSTKSSGNVSERAYQGGRKLLRHLVLGLGYMCLLLHEFSLLVELDDGVQFL